MADFSQAPRLRLLYLRGEKACDLGCAGSGALAAARNLDDSTVPHDFHVGMNEVIAYDIEPIPHGQREIIASHEQHFQRLE